jgi:hypothetical protein
MTQSRRFLDVTSLLLARWCCPGDVTTSGQPATSPEGQASSPSELRRLITAMNPGRSFDARLPLGSGCETTRWRWGSGPQPCVPGGGAEPGVWVVSPASNARSSRDGRVDLEAASACSVCRQPLVAAAAIRARSSGWRRPSRTRGSSSPASPPRATPSRPGRCWKRCWPVNATVALAELAKTRLRPRRSRSCRRRSQPLRGRPPRRARRHPARSHRRGVGVLR